MLVDTTRTDPAAAKTVIVAADDSASTEGNRVKLESDFLKLGLFSLRRQGVQLNLGALCRHGSGASLHRTRLPRVPKRRH